MTPRKLLETIALFFSRGFVRVYAFIRRVEGSVHDWRSERLHELNRRTTALLFFLLVLSTALYIEVVRPPEHFPTDELITIESGVPLSSLTLYLEESGAVRSALSLEIVVRILGGNTSVRAGDYLFKKPTNIFSLARALIQGNFGLEPLRIRIPEGATVTDMAQIYDKYLLRFDPDTFLEVAETQEGYLFPDTYYFLPNATEEAVIQAMRDNFDTHIARLIPDIVASGHNLNDIVIMASIIEKEAWNTEDQHLISGVLWNRIDYGMLLQVDATFTYTHNKGTYQITMADLTDEENPYNTYVHKGLPPGPISAPGLSALDAAVHPTESDYLFYLADKHGITHYSTTYEEHLRKKRLYID